MARVRRPPPRAVVISVLDRSVRIGCRDAKARAVIGASYGSLTRNGPGVRRSPDLSLEIERKGSAGQFQLQSGNGRARPASDLGRLMFLVDRELTVGLQKLRPDLYFIHAAALERGGRMTLLVAESGGGKSTLAWALLHHGFRFASDELAPIEPSRMTVHGYPRALALKAPAEAYPLPPGTIRTSRCLHVPVPDLPSASVSGPVPLGAIFFLRRALGKAPSVSRLGAAEAAARLYVNALNPLAHADDGFDTAVRIARAHPRFELRAGDLSRTSRLVRDTFDALPSR